MVKAFVGITCCLMTLKIVCMIVYVRVPFMHVAIYVVLTSLMLVSYAGTVFVSPSFPVSILNDDDDSTAGDVENGEARYCEKCDRIKPETFHHCSVCGRCIAHMDHHCPWTGNCVGLRTKKLFVLFLLYTSLACLWFANCALLGVSSSSLLSITVLLSIVVGLLLLGYFCFHVYLLAQGRTTLDFMARRRGNDLGLRGNLLLYFGANWWAYALPVVPMYLWGPPSVDASTPLT
ncbi:hypothetical protein H257_10621 [Aphanomyces astaci]|uniref:Palmitoyltransferase n=1 Tax=Aphanomyces astaci TaxID=112090 RepID=W4G7I0_APHAT|nr:hypothetical protein H257_10621 [Aphanomyces astaci]ETV75019.1 hypothetical protein H257_10621 [Aphanomyces astaci]RQM25844.1 hypothetical protein B5M09_009524 [Aphanomyces astaci]|eukprot:XP_009835523.1 hypothetical protein H257_10621 [Aphanomyces astaci]